MKEKSIDQAGLNNKSDNLVPRTVVQVNEKEFFDFIKNNKERIVVHFFNSDFEKCKKLDKALD